MIIIFLSHLQILPMLLTKTEFQQVLQKIMVSSAKKKFNLILKNVSVNML